MRYHITITDNETGKDAIDYDTDVILGVIHIEGEICDIRLSDGTGCNLAEALIHLQRIKTELYAEHPKIALLAEVLEAEVLEAEETNKD